MDIEKANAQAVEKMIEARPIVVGVGKALDVIPGMKDNMLLHAGPPITWERMAGPMKGAAFGALIFEGKAKDEKEAKEKEDKDAVAAALLAIENDTKLDKATKDAIKVLVGHGKKE